MNVYKFNKYATFYHAGIVIFGKEYYFMDSNKTAYCEPRKAMGGYYRTLTRIVEKT